MSDHPEAPGRVDAESPTQQYGYIRCYRQVVKDCDVMAAFLYGILEDYAQEGARQRRGLMPSHAHLAKIMGCSVRSIGTYLDSLREHGWVEWSGTKGKTNRYWLPVKSLLRPIQESDGVAPDSAGAPLQSLPGSENGRGPLQNLQTGRQNLQTSSAKFAERKTLRNNPREKEDPPSPPKGGKRPHRIPEDWQLTDKLRDYATEKGGVPPELVDRFAEEFVEFWRGEKRTKVDWDATFRSRCLSHGPDWTSRQMRANGRGREPIPLRRQEEAVISQEERARLEAIWREAQAKQTETAEERWARLHPEQAAKVAPIRAQTGAGGGR